MQYYGFLRADLSHKHAPEYIEKVYEEKYIYLTLREKYL